MTIEIYRARILDHFQRPRHRGGLEGMHAIGRAAIPMCGDEVEVGVREGGAEQFTVRFRGRGCAVCIASASMMAELANGLGRAQMAKVGGAFTGWMLEGADVAPLTAMVPELVETFSAVRAAGSRARCAALPWGALADALARCSEAPQGATAPAATDAAGRICSAPG